MPLDQGMADALKSSMFTARQLKDRMEEKPFRAFQVRMSSGDSYDVQNHDSAWVLRNAIEIGLDADEEGFVSRTRHCCLLHIAGIEDISGMKAA